MSASPYEQVMQKMADSNSQWAKDASEANQQEYALMQVSRFRYRVIKRCSHARVGNNSLMIVGWESATGPMAYFDAVAFLQKKLGE